MLEKCNNCDLCFCSVTLPGVKECVQKVTFAACARLVTLPGNQEMCNVTLPC